MEMSCFDPMSRYNGYARKNKSKKKSAAKEPMTPIFIP